MFRDQNSLSNKSNSNSNYLLRIEYYDLILVLFLLFGFISVISAQSSSSGYLKGDFHQHTTFTDGSYSIATMNYMNVKYGLNFWANSEHGGGFTTDASGVLLTAPPFINNGGLYWDSNSSVLIQGDNSSSSGHRKMWRWQSLKDYSFPEIIKARNLYPDKIVFQGYEWNVPGHEHCSMGLIANQFQSSPNCIPLAEFEYKFDNSDTDLNGGAQFNWVKSTLTGHAKAVEGAAWLQKNYPRQSWLVIAHPERKSLYKVQDFRDLNNAAPDVCFGFESVPGHQKSSNRGEYVKSSKSDGDCTYGGAGHYSAKIGGLWDAMLGEGRKWWLFASSDAHNVGDNAGMTNGGDFFPGEYQKTYVYAADKSSPQAIVDGMRNGNAYVVMGDLISELEFSINGGMMGTTVKPAFGYANITIRVKDPLNNNNNTYSAYTNPVLDHIDLISGKVSGRISPSSEAYTNATNTTTRVIARFDSNGGITDVNGITSIKWKELPDGWKEINYSIQVTESTYFRLRGTNHGLSIDKQTDGAGNPLPDTLIANSASAAFEDLWFYSNPIFVSESLITSINEQTKRTPTEFLLQQNYPNPFNPSTTIDYKVPVSSAAEIFVSLKVYDYLGREVANLVNQTKPAGLYSVRFDASALPSGVYFYRLNVGAISETKKMILLK